MTLKKYILETARLRLREYAESDFENVLRLNSDPEVMKYINGGVPLTEDEVRFSIDLVRGQYREWNHFGLWAAEEKATGDHIGWFSLKPLRGTTEIEVGYRLEKASWGRGLATEGARAMVDRGFTVAGLEAISAIAHPENLASKRVLEKAGFRWIRRGTYTDPLDGKKHDVDWFRQARAGASGTEAARSS